MKVPGQVTSVLALGEHVEYRARMSWVNYVPGILLLVIPPIGLMLLMVQWIRQATTEIVVTNRRLIYKVGIIMTKATDIERSQIETITLYQSIVGRLLGFGTVTIRGTGIGAINIEGIDAPMEFRRRISH